MKEQSYKNTFLVFSPVLLFLVLRMVFPWDLPSIEQEAWWVNVLASSADISSLRMLSFFVGVISIQLFTAAVIRLWGLPGLFVCLLVAGSPQMMVLHAFFLPQVFLVLFFLALAFFLWTVESWKPWAWVFVLIPSFLQVILIAPLVLFISYSSYARSNPRLGRVVLSAIAILPATMFFYFCSDSEPVGGIGVMFTKAADLALLQDSLLQTREGLLEWAVQWFAPVMVLSKITDSPLFFWLPITGLVSLSALGLILLSLPANRRGSDVARFLALSMLLFLIAPAFVRGEFRDPFWASIIWPAGLMILPVLLLGQDGLFKKRRSLLAVLVWGSVVLQTLMSLELARAIQ